MKAARAHYRPGIHNGAIPKRRPAVAKRPPAPRRQARRATAEPAAVTGLPVFGVLVGAGALIGVLLIAALSAQRNAYQIGQQEVALRSGLDRLADERSRLLLDANRALSPRATEQRGRSAGLRPLKLDTRAPAPPARHVSASKTKPTSKAAPVTNARGAKRSDDLSRSVLASRVTRNPKRND